MNNNNKSGTTRVCVVCRKHIFHEMDQTTYENLDPRWFENFICDPCRSITVNA